MSRGLFFYNECEEQGCQQEAYVFESRYPCARPLMSDSDMYMYRDNTPFCSEDCREEQIEFDEAREQKKKKKKKQQLVRQSDSDQSCPSSDIRQGGIQVA